mgnify:CR=1 FL=1
MALVKEDGTGRADANALADNTDVTAYYAARGGLPATLTGLSTAQIDDKCVLATDYIKANPRYQRWRGTKKTYAQALMFPRTDCAELDGQAVPDDVVPARVVEAVCILAARTEDLATLLPDLARGGMVTSESLTGVGSTSYSEGAPIGTVLQIVDGLLAPLLKEDPIWGKMQPRPPVMTTLSSTVPELPDAFKADYYAPYSDSAVDASAPEA